MGVVRLGVRACDHDDEGGGGRMAKLVVDGSVVGGFCLQSQRWEKVERGLSCLCYERTTGTNELLCNWLISSFLSNPNLCQH